MRGDSGEVPGEEAAFAHRVQIGLPADSLEVERIAPGVTRYQSAQCEVDGLAFVAQAVRPPHPSQQLVVHTNIRPSHGRIVSGITRPAPTVPRCDPPATGAR